jgi:hypothetical protein
MEPCIVIWLVVITNKMQLSYGIYYSTYVNSSTCFERYVAHHQEPQLHLSLWFTNACEVRPWCCLSGNWLGYRAWCYDERHSARNMLVITTSTDRTMS